MNGVEGDLAYTVGALRPHRKISANGGLERIPVGQVVHARSLERLKGALGPRDDSRLEWSGPWRSHKHLITMDFDDHVHVTGGALKHWIIAQLQDCAAVGILWFAGLHVLGVPWAPLWAAVAAVFQFVPHFGPVLGLLGPVLAAAVHWGDWMHPLYVLMMYAGIVLIDGFLLQPYLMKRVAKVPMWASILAPIVLGIVIPFWGVLLAPPLLAVMYAYKALAKP